MQHHDDIEVVAGDDWVIPFALTDANGAAIDLTGNEGLLWYLIGPDGLWVASLDQVSLVASTPLTAGKGTITVPRAITSVESGRYHDVLRVIDSAGHVQAEWSGAILVDADPAQCSP